MKHRPLGRTGIDVTPFCLGTMTFGEQNDVPQSEALMDQAVERGINFLDAAEMYPIPVQAETYGRTEEFIGNWMQARGNREKLVIASKVAGPEKGRLEWVRGADRRLNRENIRAAAEASLKRLKTDYIDLYQLHWADRALPKFGAPFSAAAVTDGPDVVPIAETLAALQELVDEGKVRAIGLSNESSYGVMKFLALADQGAGPRIASIQNAYSLLNRTFEPDLAEIAMREDVGLLPYSPIAGGHLSGKYLNGKLPEGARYTLWPSGRYRTENAEAAITEYVALAAELEITPVQLASAFAVQRPFVTSSIGGATTPEQLSEVLDGAEMTLSNEALTKIDAIHRRYTNPCP